MLLPGSQQAKAVSDLNGPGLLSTMKLDQEQRKNARKRAERYKQNLEKGEKVEA